MTVREDASLTSLLLGLERQLMDQEFRKDTQAVAALLAEEFYEFGSSGRVWTRDEILHPPEPMQQAAEVEDFAVRLIAPELAQATYRTLRPMPDGPAQPALRSSLWVWRKGRWQMLFHQGTSIPVVRI